MRRTKIELMQISDKYSDNGEYRFIANLMAIVQLAGRVLRDMDWIEFDMDRIMNVMGVKFNQIIAGKRRSDADTREDVLGDFINKNVQKLDMDTYMKERERTKKYNMLQREDKHEMDREENPNKILEMIKNGEDLNQKAFGPWYVMASFFVPSCLSTPSPIFAASQLCPTCSATPQRSLTLGENAQSRWTVFKSRRGATPPSGIACWSLAGTATEPPALASARRCPPTRPSSRPASIASTTSSMLTGTSTRV
jgi:hypothetical protein